MFLYLKKTEEDEERLWNDVKAVAEKAVDKFIEMREKEGSKMKEDICSKRSVYS